MLVGPLISATGSNIKKAGIGIARWPVVGAARVIRTVLYPWVGRLSLLLSRSGVDHFEAMPWLYMPEPLPKTYVKVTVQHIYYLDPRDASELTTKKRPPH